MGGELDGVGTTGLTVPAYLSVAPPSPPLKRCGCASCIKKPLTRLCAVSIRRGSNPGTRFCWCIFTMVHNLGVVNYQIVYVVAI